MNFPCSRTSNSDPNDESQGHMQGTAPRTSERVNEARPQKSSRQKLPVTLYTSRGRGECPQALREVQPGDCPIIPGYLPPLPLRTVVFLPPFLLDALCLRLSKNCSAFFCGCWCVPCHCRCHRLCPCSLDIAAIDVSNWACCFASSFAACKAFKASLSASAPSLARLFASWLF